MVLLSGYIRWIHAILQVKWASRVGLQIPNNCKVILLALSLIGLPCGSNLHLKRVNGELAKFRSSFFRLARSSYFILGISFTMIRLARTVSGF